MPVMIEERTTTTPIVSRTVEWTVGLLGMLAAAIGAWMYHGPSDGELTLFAWDWNVADLAEAWPLGLLVAGGVFMFSGFAALARSIYLDNGETTASSSFSTLISSIGLILAVAYGLLWIF